MAKRRKQIKISERDYNTFLELYDRLENPVYGKGYHYRETELVDDFREFWPSLRKLAIAVHVELDISGFDWIESAVYRELLYEDRKYLERKFDLILVRVRKALAVKSGSSSVEDEGETLLNIKERFSFRPGQVLYNNQDLNVGAGAAIDITKALYENFGHVVRYKELDENSSEREASEKIRTAIRRIRKALKSKHIPVVIENRKAEGYLMLPVNK